MKTRINLYTAAFMPQRIWLSLTQMLSVWAIILVTVVLSLAWFSYLQHSAEQLAKQSSVELLEQQDQLSNLQAKVALHKASSSLQADLLKQQAEFNVKQKLLAAVGQSETFKNEGFANVMIDLAKVNDPDIRLTQINIAAGRVSLAGIAYSNSAVPRWVGQFKSSPTLAGQEFAQLKVLRNEQQQMAFELVAVPPQEITP